MSGADLGTIDAFLDRRHHGVAAEVAALASDKLAPLGHPRDDDHGRRLARELLGVMGQAGLYGHALGGAETSDGWAPDLRACCLVREELGAVSPLADAVFALQCLGSTPQLLAAQPALVDRWLPEVVAGRAMAAFAMTEEGAGSDVGAMTTTARRDGDGYVLDGAKHLISNAGIADFYTVFASTDPAAGSRGVSCFLVPADAPGLTFAGAQVMSAPHPLGAIRLGSCRVGADHRIGAEGRGFAIGMKTLDRLRPTVAAAACGMARRALDEATGHAVGRRQFGSRLADFQLVQAKLATIATELAAARLLTYRAAWAADRGAERITVEAAMAKAYATEAAQRAVDEAVQVLGGRGVLADSAVDLLYRSVRALRIYEGTTEIQQLIIARHLLAAVDAGEEAGGEE